jgi:hypothetical protein
LNFGYDTQSGTTFSFSEGARSASADFNFINNNLTLTLTNTYSGSVADPVHVLQAVFFDLPGDPLLTPVSAFLGGTSDILYLPLFADNTNPDSNNDGIVDSSDAFGGDVGGEYVYANNLPYFASQGISGVGYGLPGFDKSHLFPPMTNLEGPEAPNGPGFGLVSAGYLEGDGNGGVTGSPKVRNSVVFTLSGVSNFDFNDISNVSFEYGTDLAQVPEPSSLLLLATGMLGLGFFRKRIKK